MKTTLLSLVAAGLTMLALVACTPQQRRMEGPAGQPSSTDVNPITGSRGGTNR